MAALAATLVRLRATLDTETRRRVTAAQALQRLIVRRAGQFREHLDVGAVAAVGAGGVVLGEKKQVYVNMAPILGSNKKWCEDSAVVEGGKVHLEKSVKVAARGRSFTLAARAEHLEKSVEALNARCGKLEAVVAARRAQSEFLCL